MRRLRYLASARRDLVSILEYIARESGSVGLAERFVGRLRAQCARLANLPGTLGRARPELHPDIRSLPCEGYVIFFRYGEAEVEIVDILDGHRDIDAFFDDQGD